MASGFFLDIGIFTYGVVTDRNFRGICLIIYAVTSLKMQADPLCAFGLDRTLQ